MKIEIGCGDARMWLSARLDDELEAADRDRLEQHLATCAACTGYEQALERVRRAIRTRPAEDVPDLTGKVMERVAVGAARAQHRARRERLRYAALGAAAAATLLIGSSLPFVDDHADSARASAIVASIRRAAGGIDRYRATFEIVERGWNARVPLRRFRAQVAFAAPEQVRLEIRDLTRYPPGARWPRNDVKLVANASRWSLREPPACAHPALACTVSTKDHQRTIVHRQPYDGTTALPTDIIVPLDTLSDSARIAVARRVRVLGRAAQVVTLPYRFAVPLIRSLQPGGTWRDFHPADRVSVWLDERTWFPLRFEVRASAGGERRRWAAARAYDDRAGRPLLVVEASSFATPDSLPSRLFFVPDAPDAIDGGFDEDDLFGRTILPAYVGGLQPYRSGTTSFDQQVVSFARGMQWLKLVIDRERGNASQQLDAEQVRLDDGGFAYYRPGDEWLRRRVTVYRGDTQIELESNLDRATLFRIASSLPGKGERLPRTMQARGALIERLRPDRAADRVRFALAPSYLPAGYRPSVATLTTSRDGRQTLTIEYRGAQSEYDGFGIRITQSRPVRILLPSSEEFDLVVLGNGTVARWAAERGELEFVEDGVYRSVAAPSLTQATIALIAEGLR